MAKILQIAQNQRLCSRYTPSDHYETSRLPSPFIVLITECQQNRSPPTAPDSGTMKNDPDGHRTMLATLSFDLDQIDLDLDLGFVLLK